MGQASSEATHTLSRRSVIRLGAGFLLIPTTDVRAQDQSPLLGQWFSRAVETVEHATNLRVDDISEKTLFPYLEEDYLKRQVTLFEENKTDSFKSEFVAIAYVRSIRKSLPPNLPFEYDQLSEDSQIDVIRLCAKHSVPIAPPPELVVPANIVSVAPTKKKTHASDLQVIGDIIFETLGISFGTESVIEELMKGDPKLQQDIDSLLGAISTKNWKDAAKLLEEFLKLFLASKLWISLSERMGELAVKRFTFRMALECVPGVGWLYIVGALIVSIIANYHRFSFA